MAKKVDLAKAKAAKQKKIAIGLIGLLLVVVAVQGPRTLKMLKSPSVPAAVAAPVATATPTSTTEVAVPPLGAPVSAVPGQPAVLASSDQPPVAGTGQLLSFELFKSKDPFAQQVGAPTPTVEAGTEVQPPVDQTAGAAANPHAAGAGETPAAGGTAVPPAAGSTPHATTPSVPEAAPAAATMISVNGSPEAVGIDTEFPLEDPIFVLVSNGADGKSVQIGIVGGSYADGKDTITLMLGKRLTLQNTADGSRYELLLEAVAGFVTFDAKK